MDYSDIVAIGLGFPGVVEGTSYGTPSLKVRDKFLLRLREPGVLVLKCTGMDERDLLVEADPDLFFITDHYRGYPFVLVRIETLPPSRFRHLFAAIWRKQARKTDIAAYDARRNTADG